MKHSRNALLLCFFLSLVVQAQDVINGPFYIPSTDNVRVSGTEWRDIFANLGPNLDSYWIAGDCFFDESMNSWVCPTSGVGDDMFILNSNITNSFLDLGKDNDLLLLDTSHTTEIQAGDGNDVLYVPGFSGGNNSGALVVGGEGNDTLIWGENSNWDGGLVSPDTNGVDPTAAVGGNGDDIYYYHMDDAPMGIWDGGLGNDTLYIQADADFQPAWQRWALVSVAQTVNTVLEPDGRYNVRMLDPVTGAHKISISHPFAETGIPDSTNNNAFIENIFVVTSQETSRTYTLGSSEVVDMDNNPLLGTGGNDTLDGDAEDNTIDGMGGDDTINGGDGDDLIFGDTNGAVRGNDIIDGGPGNDQIFGFNGHDVIKGGDGDDTLHGANGRDHFETGSGTDIVYGGNDPDTILMNGPGRKFANGGSNNDTYFFYDGAYGEVYDESGGFDVLIISNSSESVVIAARIPDLTLTFSNGEEIVIRGYYEGTQVSPSHGIESININGTGITIPTLTASQKSSPYLAPDNGLPWYFQESPGVFPPSNAPAVLMFIDP